MKVVSVATSIVSSGLTTAWLDDLKHLLGNNLEDLNLITTVENPTLTNLDSSRIEVVNRWLVEHGKQQVETVANTIFPSALLQGAENRQEFYDRYLHIYPRLRRLSGNHMGTYFGRLISYPGKRTGQEGIDLNQIEEMIEKIVRLRRNPNTQMRFAYQMQIYDPTQDMLALRGFPCLSFVSLQIYQGRLCVTGTYRNQRYFERALGNFLGLARLQAFLASQVELPIGELTIHASHAQIDTLGKRKTRELIGDCG